MTITETREHQIGDAEPDLAVGKDHLAHEKPVVTPALQGTNGDSDVRGDLMQIPSASRDCRDVSWTERTDTLKEYRELAKDHRTGKGFPGIDLTMSRQSPRDEFRRIEAFPLELSPEVGPGGQKSLDDFIIRSLLEGLENVFEHERLQDRSAPQRQLQSMKEMGSVCLAASSRNVVIP